MDPVMLPMLMAVIDLNAFDSPAQPQLYDSLVRLEGRIHRRGKRGSNLWQDQPLLRTMYQLSTLSHDHRHARAADAYFESVLRNCQTKTGFLFWGSHCYWDCFEDKGAGNLRDGGVHEILIHHAIWEKMYQINRKVTRQFIDNIWKYHIQDRQTGMHNRDNSPGNRDFPFLSSLTALHAAALLRCYEITGEKHVLEIAVTYLKAYDQYGWGEEAQNYLGMIHLDGTPTAIEDVPIAMRNQVFGQTTAW